MNIVIIKQFSIIIIKAALRIKMILHVKVNKKKIIVEKLVIKRIRRMRIFKILIKKIQKKF